MAADSRGRAILSFPQGSQTTMIDADPVLRLSRVTEVHEHGDRKMKTIRKFIKNSKGATAIEYGLIAALIAVAAIAAMQGLGGALNKTFNNVSGKLSTNVAN